jgi:hypothetical protein
MLYEKTKQTKKKEKIQYCHETQNRYNNVALAALEIHSRKDQVQWRQKVAMALFQKWSAAGMW